MSKETDIDRAVIDRRTLLSRSAGTAAAVAGFGMFTGNAAAWTKLKADFRGCSEVWILAGENDFECVDKNGDPYDGPNDKCPLVVKVVVATGSGIDCRTVEVEYEATTLIPGQYGDQPVIKYSVSGGEKILGIIGLSPSRNPVCADLIVNDHRCTQTPNTPSIYDAECVPCDEPSESATVSGPAGGPPHGRGPPWSR